MKISASIYSDTRPLEVTVRDLSEHLVDMLHVDCNDNLSVFDDIRLLRTYCDLPVDLHLITQRPQDYEEVLMSVPVEYLTYQHEELPKGFQFPKGLPGKKGIAITTSTPIEEVFHYEDMDFVLIMATVPGQSGGIFDRVNFEKIRRFKQLFPNKSVHVDGGVNAEVSFILRNLGVTTAVSGSFLFKGPSVGHALMELTKRKRESAYKVADFMIPLDECPVVLEEEANLRTIVQCIDEGRLGFCMLTDAKGTLTGISSNADVRKGIIRNLNDLNAIDAGELINRNVTSIHGGASVNELLHTVRNARFPIAYLPVVDASGKAVGVVTFVNLIKGEL